MEYATTLGSVQSLTSQNWLGADPYDAAETSSAGVQATALLLAVQTAERNEPSLLGNIPWRRLEAVIQAAIDGRIEAEMPDTLCS